jgi:exodeoxyribonuclease V alpha subunit
MAIREMTTKYAGQCVGGHAVPAGAKVKYDSAMRPAIRACPSCDASLVAQVEAPQSALRVTVQFIKHASDEGFVVATVLLDDDQPEGTNAGDLPVAKNLPFPCVGQLGKIQVGDLITAYGRFDFHPRHGVQFKATRAVRTVGATVHSLRAFLAGLPHSGQARAKAIIEHFKSDRAAVLQAIEHQPERLTAIRGITTERALQIRDAFLIEGDLRQVDEWLAALELGDATRAKILDTWGKKAQAYLEEDPYRLMELPGFGFVTADEIALSRFRVHPQDVRRATAAVLFLLEEEEAEGHTWSPLTDFVGFGPIAGI